MNEHGYNFSGTITQAMQSALGDSISSTTNVASSSSSSNSTTTAADDNKLFPGILPAEMNAHIVSFLDRLSIFSVRKVSRYAKDLADHEIKTTMTDLPQNPNVAETITRCQVRLKNMNLTDRMTDLVNLWRFMREIFNELFLTTAKPTEREEIANKVCQATQDPKEQDYLIKTEEKLRCNLKITYQGVTTEGIYAILCQKYPALNNIHFNPDNDEMFRYQIVCALGFAPPISFQLLMLARNNIEACEYVLTNFWDFLVPYDERGGIKSYDCSILREIAQKSDYHFEVVLDFLYENSNQLTNKTLLDSFDVVKFLNSVNNEDYVGRLLVHPLWEYVKGIESSKTGENFSDMILSNYGKPYVYTYELPIYIEAKFKQLQEGTITVKDLVADIHHTRQCDCIQHQLDIGNMDRFFKSDDEKTAFHNALADKRSDCDKDEIEYEDSLRENDSGCSDNDEEKEKDKAGLDDESDSEHVKRDSDDEDSDSADNANDGDSDFATNNFFL